MPAAMEITDGKLLGGSAPFRADGDPEKPFVLFQEEAEADVSDAERHIDQPFGLALSQVEAFDDRTRRDHIGDALPGDVQAFILEITHAADPVLPVVVVQLVQDSVPVHAGSEQPARHLEGGGEDGIGEVVGVRRHAGHEGSQTIRRKVPRIARHIRQIEENPV